MAKCSIQGGKKLQVWIGNAKLKVVSSILTKMMLMSLKYFNDR